ncbi:MAG: hypothetical protein ACRDPD_26415 [Streptosporangiaceae bacterium]
MPVRYRRAAVAAVMTAVAVAVPVAAFASSPGSPATKPAHSPATLKTKPAAGARGTGEKGEHAGSSLTGPSTVAALAARLGVSTSAARHAFQQIGALSGKDGIDSASPAFATIARDLGVSPARLAGALDGVKESAAGR